MVCTHTKSQSQLDAYHYSIISEATTYVEDLSRIVDQLKEVEWNIFKVIVENGVLNLLRQSSLLTRMWWTRVSLSAQIRQIV